MKAVAAALKAKMDASFMFCLSTTNGHRLNGEFCALFFLDSVIRVGPYPSGMQCQNADFKHYRKIIHFIVVVLSFIQFFSSHKNCFPCLTVAFDITNKQMYEYEFHFNSQSAAIEKESSPKRMSELFILRRIHSLSFGFVCAFFFHFSFQTHIVL